MSDNALTVIHWSRYDGTAQTRPHSVKDVYPLPRAGSAEAKAVEAPYMLIPSGKKHIEPQAFQLLPQEDYDADSPDGMTGVFLCWVWEGFFTDGSEDAIQYHLCEGDCWAPRPEAPEAKD